MTDESILEETWSILRSILGLQKRPRHLKTNPPMDMLRLDGSRKGPGWLGTMKNKEGYDVSELSVGLPGTEEGFYPLLTPNLSPGQVNRLIGGGGATPDMYERSRKHAKNMEQQGKSPFAPGGYKPEDYPRVGAKEKPKPLKKAKEGYIPGTLDALAEEQGLASDDPHQLGSKMEAWRRSGSKGRKP